jgi:hypothetical protein
LRGTSADREAVQAGRCLVRSLSVRCLVVGVHSAVERRLSDRQVIA